MAYSPAPLALDRTKPSPWNVEGAFVAPEYQDLWRGLVFLVAFWNDDSDLIRRKRPVSVGSSAVWASTAYGPARDFPADTNGFVRWSLDADQRAIFQGEHTVWAFGFSDSLLPGNNPLLAMGDSANEWMALAVDSSSGGRVINQWDDNSVRRDVITIIGASLGGRWISLGGVRRGGTYYSYLDGDQINTGAVNNNFTLTSANIESGREPWNTANDLDGKVLIAGLWNRALSASDLRRLHVDPSGLIRPNWDYLTATGFDPANLQASVLGSDVTLTWDV